MSFFSRDVSNKARRSLVRSNGSSPKNSQNSIVPAQTASNNSHTSQNSFHSEEENQKITSNGSTPETKKRTTANRSCQNSSFIEDTTAMLKKKKYFHLVRLFILHFIFSLGGCIYLLMTLSGIYRSSNNLLQNFFLSIAASSIFAGIWEVVQIWHRAIPRNLSNKAERRKSEAKIDVSLLQDIWQASVLLKMNGTGWMMCVLTLVFVSVIVSVEQIGESSFQLRLIFIVKRRCGSNTTLVTLHPPTPQPLINPESATIYSSTSRS